MKVKAEDFLTYLKDNIDKLHASCNPQWHPLGFVSCIIKEESDHIVRMHYWPPGERRTKNPDWPIHTHSYDLSSYIIHGIVRDIQYSVATPGDNTIYSVRYFKGGSEITKTQAKAKVNIVTEQERHAGQQYEVSAGVFHQSFVPTDISALTIVALTNLKDCAPLVLGSEGQQNYPYERTSFDKDIFWTNIKDALRKH